MKTKTDILRKRKHLYELIGNFQDKELFALNSFAEFLLKTREERNYELLNILQNAPYEPKELSEKTKRNLRKAEEDIQKGRYRPLSELMKDYDL